MDYSLRQRLKPSQATDFPRSVMFHDIKDKKISSYLTEKSWLLIFLFYLGIFMIVLYCDVVRFPTPLSVFDLQKSSIPRSQLFSEERTRSFVVELSSIGPKPTGSYENEVLAVDYLLRQLNHIKSNLKPSNKIDIDVQKASGCFPLRFKDGMTSCYKNVKNIVAKIGPPIPTNTSLLVNCHFDSVPTSPGASDDIVSCAVMLEVLLSLSQLDTPLPHSVIFLFNGAEENLLQAAHGFITQHKWAKEVVGFINLEACGAGGKQMMFQADKEQTWLVQAFAKGATYPQGSVVAQDIFQSGIIPSDTDYRIFEHFGGLPGLDFAFVKNGYVYHTKYDTLQFINPGAIQQAGENLLHLIHHSLQSPAMHKPKSQPPVQLVFFDLLGFFMLTYRASVAAVINIIIIMLTVIDMVLKFGNMRCTGIAIVLKARKVGKALLLLIASLLIMLTTNALIALFLGSVKCTMSWYRTPILIIGLYGCPALATFLGVHCLVKRKRKMTPREDWLQEDIYFDAARIFWIALLIMMQLANINSSFICSAWVLFPTLVRGFGDHILHLTGFRGSSKSHLIVHLAVHAIPLPVLLYCVWSIYTVFIPIMGRIGALLNPDIPIAVLTSVLVFLAATYMVSLVQVTSSMRNIIVSLTAVAFVSLLLVCFTPLGFPYSGDPSAPSPMRCYILHTERTFHNNSGSAVSEDSGYWVVPLDYNGPSVLSHYIQGLEEARPVDCDHELGCGMPFYIPVVSFLRKSYYVPASKPKLHSQQKFKLKSHEVIGRELHKLTFHVTGPDHMTVIISPYEGLNLIEWSLYVGTPLPGLEWNSRQTYFIYYSYGEYTEPWEFSIVLKAPKNHGKNAPLVDLSFITHHLHGHDAISGDFPSLLNNLPQWVHVTPWTCTLDMMIF